MKEDHQNVPAKDNHNGHLPKQGGIRDVFPTKESITDNYREFRLLWIL
jgi:hypothetical protein